MVSKGPVVAEEDATVAAVAGWGGSSSALAEGAWGSGAGAV